MHLTPHPGGLQELTVEVCTADETTVMAFVSPETSRPLFAGDRHDEEPVALDLDHEATKHTFSHDGLRLVINTANSMWHSLPVRTEVAQYMTKTFSAYLDAVG